MDAIAAAYGTFVGSFYTGKRGGIDVEDVRLRETEPLLHTMESQYPASIISDGYVDGRLIHWERHLTSPKSRTTIKEAKPLTQIAEGMQKAVNEDKTVILPLIAYYGFARLYSDKKITERKVSESKVHSRTAGYQDCLDPASSYKLFVDWFRDTTRADFDQRNEQRERLGEKYTEIDTPFTPLIRTVRKAVDTCLEVSGWRNLRWSFSHRRW